MNRTMTLEIIIALALAISAGPASAAPPICSWALPTFDVVAAVSEVGTVAIGLSSTPTGVPAPVMVNRALAVVQDTVQLVDARFDVCID